MDNDTIRNKNIACGVAILMLLLAIPSGMWSYGYYIFLRWIITGTAILILWIAYNLKQEVWTWIMAGIAILFNPIMPIHLDKETWVIIDFVVAVIFLASIFRIKAYER